MWSIIIITLSEGPEIEILNDWYEIQSVCNFACYQKTNSIKRLLHTSVRFSIWQDKKVLAHVACYYSMDNR
jgi:hypothetical protein